MLIKILMCYLLLVNVIAFVMYGIDKRRAKKDAWRIPEARLLLVAAAGGSVGAWLGMKVWRHKTLHKKFRYGVPAIFMLQVALALYMLVRMIPS